MLPKTIQTRKECSHRSSNAKHTSRLSFDQLGHYLSSLRRYPLRLTSAHASSSVVSWLRGDSSRTSTTPSTPAGTLEVLPLKMRDEIYPYVLSTAYNERQIQFWFRRAIYTTTRHYDQIPTANFNRTGTTFTTIGFSVYLRASVGKL